MEVTRILGAIRRRAWLVATVPLIAILALVANAIFIQPDYQSSVKLQFSAPPPQDVALFEGYRSGNARDETTVARNNFSEVLRSAEVKARAVRALGLRAGDANYDLSAALARESDFLTVTAEAATPELSARLVNAHVDESIKYYGELRSKPAVASRDGLTEQLKAAAAKVQQAETALSSFQRQNGTGDLDKEMEGYQQSIQELRVERSRRVAAANTPASLRDVDAVLEAMIKERDRLLQLAPAHNALKDDVRRARAEYEMLQEKHSEAVLKADSSLSTSFIQVVSPATAADARAERLSLASMLLALLGSIGLGAFLAVVLEALAGSRPTAWEASANRSLGDTRRVLSRAAGQIARPGSQGRFTWLNRETDPRIRR